MQEPIAVIGLACRYPGADDPGGLWDAVLSRRRMFRRIPPERLRLEDYYSADPAEPDAVYSVHAALLENYGFDRVGHRVSGRTYRATDLVHWLALDVAGRAIDDAGMDRLPGLDRGRVGVIVGNTLTGEFSRSTVMRLRWPYVRRTVGRALARAGMDDGRRRDLLDELERDYKAPFPPMGEDSLAGGLSNTIAGRICNAHDLHGGGYTVDGACASSLLAITNAAGLLVGGDVDLALAGGVDLSIDPFELVGFARTGALAPELMRVYDRRSEGFWPGEGCGFVALARRSDAVRWGARIYALIRGWGVSSDGRGGITRPEASGQRLALLRAYERAGYGPDTVELFEGHGTGTAVGDATELRALSATLAGGDRGRPAALGTVKANFGHTKAAAGVAGLIKAVLSLDGGTLPPTTGCFDPHEEIARSGSPLRVLHEPEPWPRSAPYRAGVSAMGFGGINTHVTLEGVRAPRRTGLTARERLLASTPQDHELFLLGAAGPRELGARARELADAAPMLSFGSLRDLAIDLALRGPDRPATVRAAVLAATPDEFGARMAALAERIESGRPPGSAEPVGVARGTGDGTGLDRGTGVLLGGGTREPRIGFLFPGQAAPTYRDGGALARRFGDTAGLFAETGGPGGDPADTSVAQPAIVACSAAAARVLDGLGIGAHLAVGHSLGELAALHWAGALEARELVRLARARGLAMAAAGGGRPGAMAAISAPRPVVLELTAGLEMCVAAYNGAANLVVSGPAGDVREVLGRARTRGVAAAALPVSHAFHSPMMDGARDALKAELDALGPLPGAASVVSTVTGRRLDDGADVRELLLDQLVSPVRFAEAARTAAAECDLLVEVGPGRVLGGLAAREGGPPVVSTDAGSGTLRPLLAAVAAAYVLGAPVDTAGLAQGRHRPAGDPLARPAFLANRCELAPLDDGALPVPAPPDAVSAPGPVPPAAEGTGPAGNGPAGGAAEGRGEAAGADPVEVVRRLVARQAELPLEVVSADASLLTDLNLNSITIGQIAADGAAELGVRPPLAAAELAGASVGDLAAVLAEAEPDDGTGGGAAPEGVASWLRPMEVAWVPRDRIGGRSEHCWEFVAVGEPDGGPEVKAAFDGGAGAPALAVHVSPDRDTDQARALLTALRRATDPEITRLAVLHHGTAGGITRTLAMERPDLPVRLIDLGPGRPDGARLREEAETGTGFEEVRLEPDGARLVPRMREFAGASGPARLGAADVLLVTGGGRGIGAESALALAAASGAKVAVLGRGSPAGDEEISGNLRRMAAAGIEARYVRADVQDAEAVRAAVAEAERALGPVTAILHAAGVNRPRLLTDLDGDELARTLGPKTTGLANLLAAVDTGRLRALVAFGSVIARCGMRGEAGYALANDWMRQAVDAVAAALPDCRCLTLEWSVWSGAGMAERLDLVESLARMGVMPIAPGDGVELLLRLLDDASPATSVIATGRLGDPPTLRMDAAEPPLLRFLERTPVHYPGIEMVAEATLSTATDAYLSEHALDGLPLLPAVVGLEAMAQVASAVTGTEPDGFEEVELARPVTVPHGAGRTIRIAALVRDGSRAEVVIRSDETRFEADHFRAVCRFGEGALRTGASDGETVPDTDTAAAAEPGPGAVAEGVPEELYGRLLFHGTAFQRVRDYRVLRARRCEATVTVQPGRQWFGDFLPQRLLLGDPGARDAFVHAAQACIPHSRVLPMSVRRIRTSALPGGDAVIEAVERASDPERLVFDLRVRDDRGRTRELWEGLVLRILAPLPEPERWQPALLVNSLERRIAELLPAGHAFGLATGADGGRAARTRAALGRAAREDVEIEHRSDGAPEIGSGMPVSVSHSGPYTLAVAGRPGGPRVACDLEQVRPRTPEQWRGLLGEPGARLAELLAGEHGGDLSAAATRVWSALECLRKAGRPTGEPLVLDPPAAGQAAGREPGWALLRSGSLRIATRVFSVGGESEPFAVAVLGEREAR